MGPIKAGSEGVRVLAKNPSVANQSMPEAIIDKRRW